MSRTPQDVRKRGNKTRTFAPPDNTTKSTAGQSFLERSSLERTDEEKKALKELDRLKLPDDIELARLSFDKTKRPKDFNMDEFLKNRNKYEDINLTDVKF